MAKKEKLEDVLNLAQGQIDAVTDTEIEALNAAQEQANIDMLEREYLQEAQTAEADALRTYNDAQYANLGQITSKIEDSINKAKQKDETARRRENAFRYISGLGDTLSGIANLVGTAHGAANQNQTYNSHAVVQKAEAARKARKLEMDDLSKRLDEMTARQRELKASGSLKEAELKANQAREMAKLVAAQREKADAMKVAADEKTYRAMRDARKDWEADRSFTAQEEQRNQAQQNWLKTYEQQLRKFNKEISNDTYNFTFADGSIDVPKQKINDTNVERIFQMLPDEIKNNIKGEEYTKYETDDFGQQVRTTGYKAPSISQKLAAIGAYADNDENIKNELRRLSGLPIVKKKEKEVEPTPASTASAATEGKGLDYYLQTYGVKVANQPTGGGKKTEWTNGD